MSIQINTNGATVIGALLIALALVGCNRRDDTQTAGQKVDAAIAKTGETVDAAKAEIKREAEQVKQSADKAMTEAKQITGDAAQSAATAVTDSAITTGIKAKLAADAQLKALDISVETSAGHATLRGTAPDAASQARATQLAASVNGVTAVDNQLTVAR